MDGRDDGACAHDEHQDQDVRKPGQDALFEADARPVVGLGALFLVEELGDEDGHGHAADAARQGRQFRAQVFGAQEFRHGEGRPRSQGDAHHALETLEAAGGEHHQQRRDDDDEERQLQGDLVAQDVHVQVCDLGQRQHRDSDGSEGGGHRVGRQADEGREKRRAAKGGQDAGRDGHGRAVAGHGFQEAAEAPGQNQHLDAPVGGDVGKHGLDGVHAPGVQGHVVGEDRRDDDDHDGPQAQGHAFKRGGGDQQQRHLEHEEGQQGGRRQADGRGLLGGHLQHAQGDHEPGNGDQRHGEEVVCAGGAFVVLAAAYPEGVVHLHDVGRLLPALPFIVVPAASLLDHGDHVLDEFLAVCVFHVEKVLADKGWMRGQRLVHAVEVVGEDVQAAIHELAARIVEFSDGHFLSVPFDVGKSLLHQGDHFAFVVSAADPEGVVHLHDIRKLVVAFPLVFVPAAPALRDLDQVPDHVLAVGVPHVDEVPAHKGGIGGEGLVHTEEVVGENVQAVFHERAFRVVEGGQGLLLAVFLDVCGGPLHQGDNFLPVVGGLHDFGSGGRPGLVLRGHRRDACYEHQEQEAGDTAHATRRADEAMRPEAALRHAGINSSKSHDHNPLHGY
ncbi:hypothetical protein NNJEOMEG_03362 [Fundidesulfovibrio magnetotacticus]|uniref:Uncharacterized protein n=1 Tax=Fundidesulfovibrio magnetotacticus TaxID=2730080 RepID=A0A6V8M0W9_9BACT|nr:hypothetical protein NNJEOMEG_03362 [Fundidesulfovibrio magnetotacticus]